jgi:hypothetical protein
MARLSGWLASDGLDVSDLTPPVVASFIAELRGLGYRNPRSVRGFGTLVAYLRRLGAIPVPALLSAPPGVTAEEGLLDRYRRYLIGQRGICEAAAENYIRRVRRFLDWRTIGGEPGLGALTAADVSAFVLAEVPARSTRWGKDLTLALRSFLVFVDLDGVLEDSLAQAVPRVAGWRLAGLPRPLEPGVAQRLVSSSRDAAVALEAGAGPRQGGRDDARRSGLAGGGAARLWQEQAGRAAAAAVGCGRGAGQLRAPRPSSRRHAGGVRVGECAPPAAHPWHSWESRCPGR